MKISSSIYELATGRRFVFYWYFQGWTEIQFGLHISFRMKNIEVHLPFGFFRVGLSSEYKSVKTEERRWQK